MVGWLSICAFFLRIFCAFLVRANDVNFKINRTASNSNLISVHYVTFEAFSKVSKWYNKNRQLTLILRVDSDLLWRVFQLTLDLKVSGELNSPLEVWANSQFSAVIYFLNHLHSVAMDKTPYWKGCPFKSISWFSPNFPSDSHQRFVNNPFSYINGLNFGCEKVYE